MLQDKLFMRTGIEVDQLDIIWHKLKLDNDPEYLKMMKEFDEAVTAISRDAEQRDKR